MCDKIFKIILLVFLAVIIFILIKGTITIRTKWGATKIGLGTGLRNSCLFCVRKHLGKAAAQFAEVNNGYPEHFGLAIGNMSEAEDESIREYPQLSAKIRQYRLKIEKGDKTVDLMDLLIDVNKLLEQK